MDSDKPNSDDDNREPEVDPEEIDEATERLPRGAAPPEVSRKVEKLTEWDQPPESSGKAAPKVLPDDEKTVAGELVEEGAEEADREQRIAAVDPDFEP